MIYATSPPLTIALPALAAAARWQAPLVFEVRDLWPEAPIQMGALTEPAPAALGALLEQQRLPARAAGDRALAGHPRRRDRRRRAAPEKVELVPNAADLDLFSPADGRRERLGSATTSSCSYFGTMGEANDLTAAVEAARAAARHDLRAAWATASGARELERAAPRATSCSPGPPPARSRWRRSRRGSGACLTFFKDVPVLATNSPNKLFDTFAAGRPAIVNMDGWMRRLVEDNDAGLYVRAGDAGDLAQKLAWLRATPRRSRAWAATPRALAEREFDRDKLAGARARDARGGGAR